ncbi:hypothetical protein [Haloarchaeobius sp. HME9146]|uniref:hypothetical protein n=1 Tax=Haloarchaeobius sp. HME9146 TaxID=2978732 RepID=UPI0021C1B7E4|nr:hypothetical protein [Haloarchaeobius sp. HME9146]MCT9095292.1 hypothetical protein [Haloarchaeobius sp. HME9146]
MTQEGGGAPQRRGQEYQDLAAAYYFLRDESANSLHIEKHHADFAFFYHDGEYKRKFYFEAKSRKRGQITWSYFSKNIAPNLEKVFIEEETTDETIKNVVLVSNVQVQQKIGKLVDDIRRLRDGAIGWNVLSTKHERKIIDSLVDDLEEESKYIEELLRGFDFKHHTKKELIHGIEEYLRECSPGKARFGRKKIIDKIESIDSGTVTREELQNAAGFRLKRLEHSTNSSGQTPEELQSAAQEVHSKYGPDNIEVDEPARSKEDILDYAEYLRGKDKVDEVLLETLESRTEENFEELQRLREQERRTETELSQDIGKLIDMDDSTSSEADDD